MPGTTTAGTDARFANLLEPIRDLAQNWSIDIASELEEYLGELEAITISFDELDGRTLNFVEAAMVIQGSACIYGKKVEHLHELVLQTLHQIIEKKKSKEAQAQAAADGAVGTDLDAAGEEDEEFEPLEGTLKEVDNINLPAGGAQRCASEKARCGTAKKVAGQEVAKLPERREQKRKRLFRKWLVLWWFRPLQGSSGVWNWAFP